jgi:phosphoribosylanthranilate isomerase
MTQVKICGLSTAATLDAAIAAGASFVGLVFYSASPRHVPIDTAASLASRARGRAQVVALVVDETDDVVGEIARRVAPDFFQAHGSESPERITAISASTGIPVIKAIKVGRPEDVEAARNYREAAAMVHFDARAPENLSEALPGGNGLSFDWTLLSQAGTPKRFMLGGGLTPANVRAAIATTGAPIVDVSSGVESAPGIKDPALIVNFIEATRAAR